MAWIENAKGEPRIVRCPALRTPEAVTGTDGCDATFFDGEAVGKRRSLHFAEHDPEDFDLSPLQSRGSEPGTDTTGRTPVGGD